MNQTQGPILAHPTAVNVAYLLPRCRVLGPGERFVIWVQGCPLRCHGCHNPDFLTFREIRWYTIEQLLDLIIPLEGLEGITFVGGEPFAQARALADLAAWVRRSGLSVMTYSGFTLTELQADRLPGSSLLLNCIDLLMDGPFQEDLPTRRPWRGSDNQHLYALSSRYAEQETAWNQPVGQDFEVRINPDGHLEVVGIPPEPVTTALQGDTDWLSESQRITTNSRKSFNEKGR
jgi:anaerobic ribonucleoside-triphosphate reductase activating protein